MSDSLRFIGRLITQPKTVGAIAPSSKALGRKMAAQIDVAGEGPILELGPGTGVATAALIARGAAPERITAIEYDPDFAQLIAQRFPKLKVINGDAFDLGTTLGARQGQLFDRRDFRRAAAQSFDGARGRCSLNGVLARLTARRASTCSFPTACTVPSRRRGRDGRPGRVRALQPAACAGVGISQEMSVPRSGMQRCIIQALVFARDDTSGCYSAASASCGAACRTSWPTWASNFLKLSRNMPTSLLRLRVIGGLVGPGVARIEDLACRRPAPRPARGSRNADRSRISTLASEPSSAAVSSARVALIGMRVPVP